MEVRMIQITSMGDTSALAAALADGFHIACAVKSAGGAHIIYTIVRAAEPARSFLSAPLT